MRQEVFTCEDVELMEGRERGRTLEGSRLDLKHWQWEGSWVKARVVFHCCFLSQLGFNIRGGKASQLGIFISKVCLSFCHFLTCVLSVPLGVAEPAGCAGRLSYESLNSQL